MLELIDGWTVAVVAAISVSWLALYWIGRSGEWLARKVLVEGPIVVATEAVRLLSGVRGLRRELRAGRRPARVEKFERNRERVARLAGWLDERVTETSWRGNRFPLTLVLDERRAKEDLRMRANQRLEILEGDDALLLCFSDDGEKAVRGLLKLLFLPGIRENEVAAVAFFLRGRDDPEVRKVLEFHGERFRMLEGARRGLKAGVQSEMGGAGGAGGAGGDGER